MQDQNFRDVLNSPIEATPQGQTFFTNVPDQVNQLILCCTKSQGDFMLHANKIGETWHNYADPIPFTDQDMSNAVNQGWCLTARPKNHQGFTYFLLMRDELCETTSIQVATCILAIAADQHNRDFNVTPQPEVVDLLCAVPDAVSRISLKMQIDFKERKYVITEKRQLGEFEPLPESIVADPQAVVSALRACGWVQIGPPSHGKVGNNWRIVLERGSGPCYRIDEATDTQVWKARERGLAGHFTTAMGR